jgi:hypothetical protein
MLDRTTYCNEKEESTCPNITKNPDCENGKEFEK